MQQHSKASLNNCVGTIRVMLVDDSEPFLRVAIDLLQRHSAFVVVGAHGGHQEALTQAKLLEPQAILVDLELAGPSGLEMIAQIKRAVPNTRIIGLTIGEDNAYRQVALAAGAAAVMPKTALTTDLIATIMRVLDS